MRCSNCGSPITTGQGFCGACGATLVAHCPSCGASVPLGYRFCGDCGADVSGGMGGQQIEGSSRSGAAYELWEERKKRTSPWLIVLAVFVTIVLLAAGAVLAFDALSQSAPAGTPAPGETPAPAVNVTLRMYVHEGSTSGLVLSGVQVTGQDGDGNLFNQTTNSSGYVTITGIPGTWQFTALKPGYQTNNWSQDITTTDTKHAYLEETPPATLSSNLLIYLDENYTELWDSTNMPDLNNLAWSASPSQPEWETSTLIVFLKNAGNIPIKVNATGYESLHAVPAGFGVSSDTIVLKPNEYSSLAITIDVNPMVRSMLYSDQDIVSIYFHIDAAN